VLLAVLQVLAECAGAVYGWGGKVFEVWQSDNPPWQQR